MTNKIVAVQGNSPSKLNPITDTSVFLANEIQKDIENDKKDHISFNHGNNDFIINNNDRIAQMILTPVIKMELEETESLPETVRGEDGFGSTGK